MSQRYIPSRVPCPKKAMFGNFKPTFYLPFSIPENNPSSVQDFAFGHDTDGRRWLRFGV
ncbi:hypothetical protein [Nostoc sp.]|uniref:hypothetical protein n=1 Tax=Nostoc sp. TaxID=1180 RepID=UPI002FF4FF88